MARKINPITSGGIFPLIPQKPPKKDVPLAGKVVPPPNSPAKNRVSIPPKAGAVSQPKHTGRNIAITAALVLVTLGIIKSVKDYNTNRKAEKSVEVVKK